MSPGSIGIIYNFNVLEFTLISKYVLTTGDYIVSCYCIYIIVANTEFLSSSKVVCV